MKFRRLFPGIALGTLLSTLAATGQSISINFGADQANGVVNTGSALTAGAVPVAGTAWNNAAGATGTAVDNALGAGHATLVDSTGADTAATVTWNSTNTYLSGSTGSTATSLNGSLLKGYLDDSANTHSVTVGNIPYLFYKLYFITGTDQGSGKNADVNYRPVQVNGTSYTFAAGNTVVGTANYAGKNWNDADALVEGQNYLEIENLTGSSVVVKGGANTGGARGPIAGIQIVNAYAGTQLYWDTNGATAGSGPSPTGIWDASTANWNNATGDGTPVLWTGTAQAAIFSAGNDAAATPYTVTVSGTRNTDALVVEDGDVNFSGGNIAFNGAGLLKVLPGASAQLDSGLGGSGGLVVEGGGQVILAGAASYTGGTVFGASTGVLLAGGNAVPDASPVTSNGAALTLVGNEAFGEFAGSGTLELNDKTLTINSAAPINSVNYSGVISGLGGGLIINAANEQGLSAANTFDGGVQINSGRVRAGNVAAFGTGLVHSLGTTGGQAWLVAAGDYTNPFNIEGLGFNEGTVAAPIQYGALRIDGGAVVTGGVTLSGNARIGTPSGAGTISGVISGTANLEKNGAGDLNLEADNSATFSGKVTASGGILRAASTESLGAYPAVYTADAITLRDGARLQGGSRAGGANLVLDANRGISVPSGTAYLHPWTGFSITVGGDITGAGGLQKSDGGDLTVNGSINVGGLFATYGGGNATFNDDITASDFEVGGNVTATVNSTNLVSTNGFSGFAGATTFHVGTATLDDIELGNASGQAHTLNITSGTVNVAKDVRIGHWAGETSTLNISAGTLNLTGTVTSPTAEDQSNLMLGIDGTGILNISGTGTVNTPSLVMDGRSPTDPDIDKLTLTGGNLNVGQWGIRGNGSSYLVELGAGTVGALANWSSSVPMTLTDATTGVTFNSGSNAITLTGVLSGAGNLNVTGGDLTINAANTYSGLTSVTGGRLQVGGTLVSPVSVTGGTLQVFGTLSAASGLGAGATLATGTKTTPGTGTVTTFGLDNGTFSKFRVGASGDKLVVTTASGLTVAGGHQISVEPVSQVTPGSTFTLIDYDTSLGGAGFAGLSLAALPNPHYTAVLVDNVANTSVDVQITGADSIVWTGAADGNWNTGTTNWKRLSDSGATNFFAYDSVIFDDTASPSRTNVTLTADVTTAAVAFNNSTLNYTLGGSGITGAGGITKSGTATLTLTNTNSFTGNVIATGGKIVTSAAANLGTSAGKLSLSAATLQATASYTLAKGLEVLGTGTATIDTGVTLTRSGGMLGGGALTKNGPGTLAFTGYGNGSFNAGSFVINEGTIQMGTALFNTNINLASITVNNTGRLLIPPSTAHGLGGYATAVPDINLTQGGVFEMNSENYLRVVNMTGATISGTAELRTNADFVLNTLASSVTSTISAGMNGVQVPITCNVADGAAAVDLLVTGPIINTQKLVKNGAGVMRITGIDTISGATEVNAGRLIIDGTHNTSDTTVAVGATLSGSGSVKALTVAGTVAPGASAGTLTAAGNVTLTGTYACELDGVNADKLAITGDLTLTGSTLAVTTLVGGATQPSYVIATYTGARTGNFVTTTGLTGYVVQYDDANKQVLLVQSSGTGYNAWATSKGLTGGDALPDADPDHDGVKNLMEYVINGNPNGSSTAALPTQSYSGANLLFHYLRNDDSKSDTTQTVQWSTNLTSWNDISIPTASAGAVTIVENTTSPDDVTVSIPLSNAGSGGKLFVRLKVTQP